MLRCLPYLSDARRVTVEGPRGDPVQADGDFLAALPADISILPDALTLVFPA